jgi:preprotein translocase subunit SecG
MLYGFLLVLLVIDSLVLIAAVLLQAGQGGGMAASFGGVSSSASSFLGTRQTGNLLTKASWWCGGLFLGLAFLLSLASTRSRAPKSILDQTFVPTPVTAPANNAPAPSANPAIPLTPAPNAAPANAPAKAPATAEKKAPAPATPAKKP